jgi:hypothetical protein
MRSKHRRGLTLPTGSVAPADVTSPTMSGSVFHGVLFAAPISLALWLAILWAVLALL